MSIFKKKKPTSVPPKPTPPAPPVQNIGLNMANSTKFTDDPTVVDYTKQVLAGLSKKGSKPTGRYPGGTDANYFFPLGADSENLSKMVQDSITFGMDVIVVGNNTGTMDDDICLIEAFKSKGKNPIAFEVGNEPYLTKKYNLTVEQYLNIVKPRIANIKKHYPTMKCGVSIMPIRGMKDTNNGSPEIILTPAQQEKLEAKNALVAEAWNKYIIDSGVGDFYIQHFYPSAENMEEAINVFTGQKYDKPLYLTETNTAGTSEQQVDFYRLFSPIVRKLEWCPVVIFHAGPAAGENWPTVRIQGKNITITPFGQAMIE